METLDTEIVGFIYGEKLMWNGAVIWYFVVDGKYRDFSIGSALINHFEEYCKRYNIKWIFGASDINKKTLNFYKRHEYVLSEKHIEFTKNL